MGASPSTRRRSLGHTAAGKDSAHEKNQESDNEEHSVAYTEKHEYEMLTIGTLPTKDPLAFFQKWYEEAEKSDHVKLASVAALSTASRSGRTSSRIVRVPSFDRNGFKIPTKENSLKVKNMEENPHASLLYYWEEMGRMVRIDGRVAKLSDDVATNIWKGMERSIQIMFSASHQDEVIKNSEEVISSMKDLEKKYGDSTPIPRDPAMVVYGLIPEVWEFYQMRCYYRDRIVFRRTRPGERPDEVFLHQGREGWVIETLSP